ncbi:MAG: DoxX family protein [Bacteroidetes bacterium]|nr:DoxX family protein [Bacteroidota bacterium]
MSQNKALNVTLTIIRVFVGILFIFSGLIKANDPSGLAYKMGEFFEVWAREGYLPSLMHWLNTYAMAMSILMITFEIVAGIALIIGYRFKLFSFLILLLTIFFTFLTAYAMYSGKIKECGCFGDCIKLQANESFMKDLILLALILILVFFRKRIAEAFSPKVATSIMVATFAISLLMQWYVLKNLPVKDCLPYKIGNNILNEMTPGPNYVPEEVKTVLVYKKDGVKKEFDLTNYPWQDSTWTFDTTINTVVKKAQNEPTIKDFSVSNYNGENVTNTVLTYKGNVFLLFVKDVHTANTGNLDRLRILIQACKKANVPMLVLSSSNDIESNKFKEEHKLDIEFFTIDQTVCKTAMRANPGLMLLHNGTIQGKWSYANYPNFSTLNLDLKDNALPLFPVAAPAPVAPVDTVSPR